MFNTVYTKEEIRMVSYRKHIIIAFALTAFQLLSSGSRSQTQFSVKDIAVGSLHGWYANTGCEPEESRRPAQQQNGMQWPGIYLYQDMQAAKGLWIGATNFTDEQQQTYPFKVIHAGPRVSGQGSGPKGGFFPVRFETISKFEPPTVYVDGALTQDKEPDNNSVDPTMKADRMILNVANTSLGLTMERKILAFSQGSHDNYMVYEYTFTNTGNTDSDTARELPNQTLTGLYFYFQYRYAICREVRYVIGNETGWGKNTMNDARGDGLQGDPIGFPFRAQYSWQGYYPTFTAWNNIGAPVWTRDNSTPHYIEPEDTIGRLGAAKMIGVVTLHADRSATDRSDDITQPSTTNTKESDDPRNLAANGDQYDIAGMTTDYSWMTEGHRPRHAYRVEPTGNFAASTADPFLPGAGGIGGGWSFGNGYGPYTLRPGESVRIVMAEGAAGLSREKCISVGRRYKAGTISAIAKNDSVLTSRDSLYQTFRRAIGNFKSLYNIPQPPLPPKQLDVASLGNTIRLTWSAYTQSGSTRQGWRVYRSVGKYYAPDSLLVQLGPTVTTFDDTSAVRGVGHFYYVVSYGAPVTDTTGGVSRTLVLESSRYYAQTYDAAFLQRPPGDSLIGIVPANLSKIRIVPNPYIISSDERALRFEDEPDKIAFFEIPAKCRIRIFTELGELVREIVHDKPSGDEYWNSTTSSGQMVVSGVYIVVFEDMVTGGKSLQKLVIVR